jgi:hypothetical protein
MEIQINRERIIQSIISLTTFPDEVTKQNARNYLNGLPLAELQAKREALVTDPVEAAYAAKESRRLAYAMLQIYKHSGLRNIQENDVALDRIFGPALSLDLFRSYCDQNPAAAKLNFIWDGEPFGKAKQAEANRETAATHTYEAFCEAAKLVSVSGQANVAPNVANFGLIRSRINEPATVQRIVEALTNSSVKGLAPNDEETIRDWKREGEVRERESLCRFIAEATFGKRKTDARSPEVIQYGVEVEFQRLMTSRFTPTETLREQVAQMKEARRLSKLTPEALRAESRRGTPLLTTPALPEQITARQIKEANPTQIRLWVARFGQDAVNARLNS